MSKRIFVGNLSFNSTDNEVRRAFEDFGPVQSVAVIIDRETGRSKGFGFVEMADEAAARAITALNGTQLDGRQIAVNEARPMVRKSSEDGAYRGATARHSRY